MTCVVLLSGGVVRGQDMPIHYSIVSVSEVMPERVKPFLDRVTHIMRMEYDLSVQFIQTTPHTETTTLTFFDQFTSDRILIDTTIRVSVSADFLSPISPLLINQTTVTFDLSSAHAANILAALLAYSAGCDDMLRDDLISIVPQLSPDYHPHIAFLIGNCFLADGNFETAYDYLEAHLYDLNGAFVGFNFAWVALQTGRDEAAFDVLDEAIIQAKTWDAYPALVELLTFRARLHALNFNYDAAITDMASAIALDSENPKLYVLRGQMVLLLYEWDRVETNYNTALEIDPNYAPAYYYRGILYYTVLERENALADFEQYLDLAPAGEHATDAARYAGSIRAELDALGGN